MRPVFIVGCPRSGTTILQATLCKSGLHITNEHRFLDLWRNQQLEVKINGVHGYGKYALPKEYFDISTRLIDKYMKKAYLEFHKGHKVFGDKYPPMLTYLDWIRERFPAKFLICERDKDETVESMAKHSPVDIKDLINTYDVYQKHLENNRDKEDCLVVNLHNIDKSAVESFLGANIDFSLYVR